MVRELLTETVFFSPVQTQIALVEQLMLAQADGHLSELREALNHLLSSGGKRIRPAVVLLFGEMLGADPDRLVTLVAAIELLHTATLVHDDLIDGSLLRRGIPTINAHWSPAATVLTGDFVFARAARLAAETDSVPVMRSFAQTLATIVSGEITQLFTRRGMVSREEYYRRIHAKTASLFELAASAAALLSPVSEEVVEQAFQYGYEIGMAFQIMDDVLDFTAQQATMGKPVASDLRQGIITLPAFYYLETHPENQQLLTIANEEFVSDEMVEDLVEAIRGSGAIDKSIDEARQHVQRGIDTLTLMPPCEARQALVELARFITDRRK